MSGETIVERHGKTVLDRIHQSMILFAAGRSEALKRFLVEEGAGRDPRFWRLAQALSAFIPPTPTKSAGSTAYWRGRKVSDFDVAGEQRQENGGHGMALKPWYKIVTPREDLRDDKPLDASEFAVHLDQVRDKRAPEVYQNPARFFERTFLTKNLSGLAVEVLRRLSGVKTETSAVFNMTTQFGGGKTHSLLLLYHLASHGEAARDWQGVAGCGSWPGLRRYRRPRWPCSSALNSIRLVDAAGGWHAAPSDAVGRNRLSVGW